MRSIPSRSDSPFLSSLGGNYRSLGRGYRSTSSEGGSQRAEERRTRGRKRGQDNEEVDPNAPVVGTQPVSPTPPSSPATTTPTPTPSAGAAPKVDDSLKTLAQKYVDVYEQQSGKTLSATTRDALVADVASFYGESGTRTERLKTLVGVF